MLTRSSSKSIAAPALQANKPIKQVHSSYKYQALSECQAAALEETLNFYAIILDASYPHLASNGRYTCTLKIAEPEAIEHDVLTNNYTLVMFANKFEDLPVSQRVGEIIRVHRATVSEYKDIKHFVARVNFNSAWALFSPSPRIAVEEKKLGLVEDAEPREYRPIAFFGKNYS